MLNLLPPIDQMVMQGRRPERLSSQLGFSCDEENTTTASTVKPSVVEISTTSFLHQEASLSVQPAVEVKHSRFYCYGSESDDSDKLIYSSDCPMRSNTQRADFLAFAVKINSYGSSVLHQIKPRLVQINSSLHGSFKFNKFYQRKFQHLYTHVLRSERANTVAVVAASTRLNRSSI